MQSTSSKVLEYLRTLPEDAVFNAVTVGRNMPQEASQGGVSAMLHRLRKEGAITIVDRSKSLNGHMIDSYRIVDLSQTRVKDNYGGRRTVTNNGHAGTSTREHLSGLLLQIASEVEQMKGSLADFSTEDLLKEIGRRMKGQ